MTPLVVPCYPADPLAPARPLAAWAEEADALAARGVPTLLRGAAGALHAVAPTPPGAGVLWRGPEWRGDGYEVFVQSLAEHGFRACTAALDYRRAHELPGWIASIPNHTAETRVVPASHAARVGEVADRLGWWPLFVRDYVKPPVGGGGAVDAAELQAKLAQLAAAPGGVEGGIVLRRFEHYRVGSERRFFVWHQNVWPHPDAPEAAADLARTVTRNFWHLFYSVDVAQRDDGAWRVLKIDDGQVASRKEWPAERFAEFLQLSLSPHVQPSAPPAPSPLAPLAT